MDEMRKDGNKYGLARYYLSIFIANAFNLFNLFDLPNVFSIVY